jgi:Leucine-rich repeat (LRR) protein
LFASVEESLLWLFLENNKLIDFDLHLLSKLQNLEWLDMSYNQLTLSNASFPQLGLKELYDEIILFEL